MISAIGVKNVQILGPHICRTIYLRARSKERLNMGQSQFAITITSRDKQPCENNCPMTFLSRWNDSSERGASQGQCALWLTKDCLWFDTAISAHKRNGYISYSSSSCTTHISFLCSVSCLWSLAYIFSPSSSLFSSWFVISSLNLPSSFVFFSFFFSHCLQVSLTLYGCCFAVCMILASDFFPLFFRIFLSSSSVLLFHILGNTLMCFFCWEFDKRINPTPHSRTVNV